MALKPTIYKMRIGLSNFNNDYYDNLNLTIAQHPSENAERMMARVIAYCLHAEPELTFTKGLCAVDEPDIWHKTLDDQISLWIDVGEPSFDRIKKSCRLAKKVVVYSFNSKSNVWWTQSESKMRTTTAEFYQFDDNDIAKLAGLIERTMEWSVTITDNSAYITSEKGECDLHWRKLN